MATNDAEERPVSGPKTNFFGRGLVNDATLNFSIRDLAGFIFRTRPARANRARGVAFIWDGLELLECTAAPRLAKLLNTNGDQLESARQNPEFRLNR